LLKVTFRNKTYEKLPISTPQLTYSITQGMLKDILLWIPTLSEQRQLIKIIDNKTAKIDKAIDLQQKQIAKIKEYETTLIDSVVTGKRRV
jgi:type I restriction enzyme S subunit